MLRGSRGLLCGVRGRGTGGVDLVGVEVIQVEDEVADAEGEVVVGGTAWRSTGGAERESRGGESEEECVCVCG